MLLSLILWALNSHDSSLSVLVIIVEFKYLTVSNQSFFRLSALLIENTEVVPDLAHLWVESCGLDDVLKGISVVTSVVVEDGKGRPVYSFSWVFESSLLEVLKSFFGIFKAHVASSKDVERVSLAFVLLVSLLHEINGLVDVSLKEVGPS